VSVNLNLSADEALVLFDWLGRFNAGSAPAIEDQAEQRALWNLEALLESALVAPLTPDYDARLKAARDRLRDPVDG
jgi:hypothetical protein